MRITDHAAARAVLSDPSYVPPPAPSGAPFGTLAWLRSQVSRFASGPVHAERRALVEECLSALDPSALRAAAAIRAALGVELAEIPARVLGEALGIEDTDALVRAVDAAATGYLSGDGGPEADAAVATLLVLVGPAGDLPRVVARITVLLQAHGATAGLLRNAVARLPPGPALEAAAPASAPGGSAPDVSAAAGSATAGRLLLETLRRDPPLLVTRRVDAHQGAPVEIDLVAANEGHDEHLTFGHGLRPCPGAEHAMAIATGVLETIMEPR
ncbi:hypothetical protein GCM10010404_65350 [Nonomuraea africana]|uniref:Cytochrome P450 n=1 Tax=Nonomuraea africana TaxID=46171 RepID=A0ABR9KWN8_9ACTN|nr:hypothetical protein [Nonomuraea africana]MBE1566451.1 cytochrome P450 [Nonomuraea africana]